MRKQLNWGKKCDEVWKKSNETVNYEIRFETWKAFSPRTSSNDARKREGREALSACEGDQLQKQAEQR